MICFVVEGPKGELVGFAKGKASSHSDLPDFSGELNKIYLLSHYQRIGLGRRLVCHVVRRFLSEGVSAMVLFGVPQNPSCWFFEASGGTRLLAKNGRFHGSYGWKDLENFAATVPMWGENHSNSLQRDQLIQCKKSGQAHNRSIKRLANERKKHDDL